MHSISLVGLVENPLAVPIFGSLVVALGLAGALVEPVTPRGAQLLFQGAGLVLRPGIALVRTLARPAWAAVDVPIPSLLELALLYGVLGGLLLLPRRAGRLLVAAALVGLLVDAAWWARVRWGEHVLRVTFQPPG